MPYRKTYKSEIDAYVASTVLHPRSAREIADATRLRPGAIRNSLSRLVAGGIVEKEWDGNLRWGHYRYRKIGQ